MNFRALFFKSQGQPRLLLPAFATILLTFGVGLGATRGLERSRTEEQRARALARTGNFAAAEALYVKLFVATPSATTAIALMQNHERGLAGTDTNDRGDRVENDRLLPEDALDDVLERSLPTDVAVVMRFWRAVDKEPKEPIPAELRDAIRVSAMASPPRPWSNHALAREAMKNKDLAEAATRFEREGLAFPERNEDVDLALSLWMANEAWEHVRGLMADPRVASNADPMTAYRFAVHERDWKRAAASLALTWGTRFTVPSLAMTSVSALAWFFFCARLGKLRERPIKRTLFYVAAFGLGTVSVIPTVCLIAVEEALLNLVETGDATRDLLFFIFGVALREEASKLLLFVPLLLALRKWGEKLDILVAGAMLGLGFAAEENLGYLASGDLHTGLGRFLTANFMHMAMTAILASALDDFVRDSESYAADFSRITLTVVLMHGAYDFLLSHEEFGGSYLAMGVFFILVRMFLTAVDHAKARRERDRGLTLTQTFILAVSVVTGTSAVYAVAAVGLGQGARVMSEGMLGVAILVYAFGRTLHER